MNLQFALTRQALALIEERKFNRNRRLIADLEQLLDAQHM